MSREAKEKGGKPKTIYPYDKHIRILNRLREKGDTRSDSMIILDAFEQMYKDILDEEDSESKQLIEQYKQRRNSLSNNSDERKRMQIAWLRPRLSQFQKIRRFENVEIYELYEKLEGELK